MTPRLSIILFLSLLQITAAVEITTTAGDHYTGTIKRVEPDGIVLVTPDGIAKVKFTKLSPAVAHQYGYDSVKAAEYQKQQSDALAAQVALQAAEKARIQKIKTDLENQQMADADKKQKALVASAVAATAEKEKQNTPEIHVKVIEVKSEGCIVDVMEPQESPTARKMKNQGIANGQRLAGVNYAALDKMMEPVWNRSGNLIFIPDLKNAAEGDVKVLKAKRTGQKEITDNDHITRTLALWEPLP